MTDTKALAANWEIARLKDALRNQKDQQAAEIERLRAENKTLRKYIAKGPQSAGGTKAAAEDCHEFVLAQINAGLRDEITRLKGEIDEMTPSYERWQKELQECVEEERERVTTVTERCAKIAEDVLRKQSEIHASEITRLKGELEDAIQGGGDMTALWRAEQRENDRLKAENKALRDET